VRVDRSENLRMIAEYGHVPLVGAGNRVVYDAEHFFETATPTTPSTRWRASRRAQEAGADTSSAATRTTNGGRCRTGSRRDERGDRRAAAERCGSRSTTP